MKDLEEIRNEITMIDSSLLKLLSARIELVKKIGEYKKLHNLPIQDSAREKKVLQKLITEGGKYHISSQFIVDIWRRIFKESYTLEA